MSGYVRGIALSGMENRRSSLPGVANTDYLVPRERDFAYFAAKGFTVVRLAITWERLQPELFGPLAPAFKKHVDNCIALAKQYGMQILLEPHNYGGRLVNGVDYKIGTEQVSIAAFADFWSKVATAYADEPGIYGYDLMNEPHSMPVGCTPLTYHPNPTVTDYITNPNFADGKTGWSMDSAFVPGPDGVIHTSAGGWANLTSFNAAGGGIAVVPGATVTLSFDYRIDTLVGTGPRFRLSLGGAYGTEIVGTAKTLGRTNGAKLTHKVTFKVPAGESMVWIRIQNQNGTVDGVYGNFTLEASEYPTRQVATTTLMNQAAIDAIRLVDQTHWIVLEFDRYTGLASFGANFGNNPDVWWTDPVNKTMPSFHYYQDSDYSGSYGQPWTENLRARMEPQVRLVFDWAVAHGVKVFMGEYGVPSTLDSSGENYRQDLDAFLTLMDEYQISGTCWAAGWGYTSPTTCHPTNNYTTDRVVLATILNHLGRAEEPVVVPPVDPIPEPTPEPEPAPPVVVVPDKVLVGDCIRVSFGAQFKKPGSDANALVYESKNLKAGQVLVEDLNNQSGVPTEVALYLTSVALPYRNFASQKGCPAGFVAPPYISGDDTKECWFGRGQQAPVGLRFTGLPVGSYRVVTGGLLSTAASSDLQQTTVTAVGTGISGTYNGDGLVAAQGGWYTQLENVPAPNGEIELQYLPVASQGTVALAVVALERVS